MFRGDGSFTAGTLELGAGDMLKAFRLLYAGWCIVAIVSPSFAADPAKGKEIGKRWCVSCHLVQREQNSATDQAPPFDYLARMPDFNADDLASHPGTSFSASPKAVREPSGAQCHSPEHNLLKDREPQVGWKRPYVAENRTDS
jgi:hypothetical protein